MKYLKFFVSNLKRTLIEILGYLLVIVIFIIICILEEGTFLGINFNFNDYCNLTDVDYTAVVKDEINQRATVEITEYLTFDVHASSKNNTFKELWRELPEEEVDGLRVSYNVKSVVQILENGEELPYKNTNKMYWEDYDYTLNSTKYWHHSDGSGYYPDNDESLLIYIPWTYRDKLKFKIVYEMKNASLKYNDCSELYLSMYSGKTIKKLNSFKAQILFPEELMPKNYYAYTYGTNNDNMKFIESDSINPGYHTFSINLDKDKLKFKPYNQFIEFCLISYGPDRHIFTEYAPSNFFTDENVLNECIAENERYERLNESYKNIKIIFFILTLIIAAFIIKNAIKKCKDIKSKNKFYKPEFDYEFFRDIPSDLDPLFASELVFMKDPFDINKEKKEEYAAILLSLVRKKYVKIIKVNEFKEWDTKNTAVSLEPICITRKDTSFLDVTDYDEPRYVTKSEKTGKELEELSTTERLYLGLLQRHAGVNNIITIEEFQNKINNDYEYTNLFVKDIEKKPGLEIGVAQGYFQQTVYDVFKTDLEKKANKSFAIAIILIIVVNFISSFTPIGLAYGAYTILGLVYLWKQYYFTKVASEVILFTQYGVDEQAKWCGLYNFLNSETLMKEKEISDLVLWEKYLIYATAFGISEKVINAAKINAINIENSELFSRSSYVNSHSFHSTSRSFGNSIHTSSRGGMYVGHGYGGGGRGGGRRRRWSLKFKVVLIQKTHKGIFKKPLCVFC